MITDFFLTLLTAFFALMVVFSKKTIISAFALLMTLLSLALIYFQLGTMFLSAVQVLVNAGAIAILFIFVMMLINLEQIPNDKEKSKKKLVISAIAIAIVLGVFTFIVSNNIDALTTVNLTENSMPALFATLFSGYFLPFEIVTVLLLASIVACVVITTGERYENDASEGTKIEEAQ